MLSFAPVKNRVKMPVGVNGSMDKPTPQMVPANLALKTSDIFLF